MIDFDLTEEQQTLRDVANNLLRKECPISLVRKTMETKEGYSKDLWGKISEAGWFGLVVPAVFGGADLTCIELAIVLDEAGRVLLPGPYIQTAAIAPELIEIAGSLEQKQAFLPRIAKGEVVMTCALGEEIEALGTNHTSKIGSPLIGTHSGRASSQAEYTVSGTKHLVPYAEQSDFLFVPFSVKNDIFFALVDAISDGVEISESKTLDPTARLYKVTFKDVRVPKENIFKTSNPIGLLNHLVTLGGICTSAESVGGSSKVLDMTIEYAKTRVQFDRPIGSFQAIKHRCADMLLMLESGTAAVYYAAWAYSNNRKDGEIFGSIAKAYCSEMYSKITGQSIQIHGGIGFTWEHDLHLYFKRAKRYEYSFGDPAWHRERIARQIVDSVPIDSLIDSPELEQIA